MGQLKIGHSHYVHIQKLSKQVTKVIQTPQILWRQWMENMMNSTRRQWALKCKHSTGSHMGYCAKKSSTHNHQCFLPLTWVYKLKCYPDGHPRKFKAWLCIKGDKQIKGIDYTDKYAPVVSWTTMQMLIIFDSLRAVAHKAGWFYQCLVQAKLKKTVYVELSKLYESPDGSDVVLKLNKSLYGLVQAPLCWCAHLREAWLDCWGLCTQWAGPISVL